MDTPAAPDKSLPGPDETAVVVGGGPAGLRAAEVLAEGGCRVALYEGKPSVGRKFLVAGRGGLNLTHSEDLGRFVTRYEDETGRWEKLLTEFGPAELRAWAAGLGVETYVGTSGRVFPRGQQAAVLLRRWVARLRELGVAFHVNQRLEGLTRAAADGWRLDFRRTHGGERLPVRCRAVVLALGGASWPQTGSDGAWPDWLRPLGIPTTDWQSANCGYEVSWDVRVLAAAEGQPLKNLAVTAGDWTVPGELLVTRYGLEGGALYQLGSRLRAMIPPRLTVDFKPEVATDRLVARLPGKPGRTVGWEEAGQAWKLSAAALALLRFGGAGDDFADDAEKMAARVKRLELELRGPRPVAEAISSAGGVRWDALDETLMVAGCPGLFVAGEMVGWEAPTGGYLLQGCFATGTRAGQAARRWLQQVKTSHDYSRFHNP